jgi:putative salt-induced outer membrane protein YdiY
MMQHANASVFGPRGKRFLALAGLLLPLAGGADEVFLKNGDRLSGSVVTTTDGKLILETTYAGKIRIQWADVSHLSTEAPVRLILDDETGLTGILSSTAAGELRIAADADAVPKPLPISRIAAINPAKIVRLKITGQANAGMDVNRGNTDQDSFHVDAESIFRWVRDRFTIGGGGDLENSSGDKTQQKAGLGGKYDHFFDGKWYAYSGLNFEHDKFAGLTLRTTASAGSGYQIYETDRTNLSIEGGPAYVWQNFNGTKNRQHAAARWGLRFDHYLFQAWKVQAFHRHSLDWSVRNSSDYLLKSQTGLRVPVIDTLQATLQVNLDRDNTPAEGAKKNDYEYLVTGGYAW